MNHPKNYSSTRRFAVTITSIAVVAILTARFVDADLVSVNVEVTNNAPEGGVYLSPFWIGFHNGSFNTYDLGAASSIQLSRLAEDGNTNPISQTFANNQTLASSSSFQVGLRVQGTLTGVGGAIAPGETVSMQFEIDTQGANRYLSFASMILPSSDYFIANDNALAIDLGALEPGGDVMVNQAYATDAGTEINDFATSAGNGLFASLNLPPGQTGPNQGADQYGVSANVLLPYAGFANIPADADTNPAYGLLNFTNRAIYPSGLASIRVSAIPEPSSIGLIAVFMFAMVGRRNRIFRSGCGRKTISPLPNVL